jgi:hypothetical protein
MTGQHELNRLVLPPAGYWHKRESEVPRYNFGKGAKKEFSWYFQGKSKVDMRSVKEICKWLTKCEYMSDIDLFVEDDFWQHPVTFEYLRKGDCEDHALWAWRKLCELHVPAEFVCGQWLEHVNGAVKETGHAWVNFQDLETKHWVVMECTEKNPKKVVLPFSVAEEYYFPEFAIDGELKTYRYSIAKNRRR